jgi:hypothetical protein
MIIGYDKWLAEGDNGQTGDKMYGKNGCQSMFLRKKIRFFLCFAAALPPGEKKCR